MFQTIVVAVDGREGGLDALALAQTLAAPGAEVTAVHVTGSGVDSVAPDDDAVVTQARTALAGSGLQATGVVVHGRVTDALHKVATKLGADLLVVGAHHHRHLWSGDHTRAALHDAHGPVAVAPAGYREGSHEVRSIGVGYDESDAARSALETARDIGRDSGAEIHVTEAVRETNWPTPDSGAGSRALEADRHLSELEGVAHTVVEGEVHDALEALAREVDLLVVGSHHHGPLGRIVLGDVVADLTSHLPCPLLVLPQAPAHAGATEA